MSTTRYAELVAMRKIRAIMLTLSKEERAKLLDWMKAEYHVTCDRGGAKRTPRS